MALVVRWRPATRCMSSRGRAAAAMRYVDKFRDAELGRALGAERLARVEVGWRNRPGCERIAPAEAVPTQPAPVAAGCTATSVIWVSSAATISKR